MGLFPVKDIIKQVLCQCENKVVQFQFRFQLQLRFGIGQRDGFRVNLPMQKLMLGKRKLKPN